MFKLGFTAKQREENAVQRAFQLLTDELTSAFQIASISNILNDNWNNLFKACLNKIKAHIDSTRPKRDAANEITIPNKTELTRYTNATELYSIAANLYGGLVKLESKHTVPGTHLLVKAQMKSAVLLGNKHKLTVAISEATAKLPSTSAKVELDSPKPGIAKPTTTLNDLGFEVSFQLPPCKTFNEFKKQVTAICHSAEKAWEKRYDDNEYNCDSSDFSSLNDVADKAPRLYSCDGEFRGRVSASELCNESINSEFDPYGSLDEGPGVGFLIEGDDRDPELCKRVFAGNWRIVADGC